MPEINANDIGELEQFLEQKALGGVLLADFLAQRVFLSDPSGTNEDMTEDPTDA